MDRELRAECRTSRFFRGLAPAVLISALLVSCGVFPRFNAAITLEGRVEDEGGRALEDVRLDVRATRFDLTSESFSSKDESTFELEDGRFRFRCRRCSGVTMDFSKDGYYSESLSFHVPKEEDGTGRLRGEEARDLVRTDLRVALRSDRNKVQLVSYEATLRAAPDGPVTVAPLRLDLGSRGVALERLGRAPSREANHLPGHVRLVPTLDDAGGLAAQPLPDVPGALMRVPAPVVVELVDAEGGFLLHRVGGSNPRPVYREMRTAPAEGYEPSLAIDTADRNGPYYFFVRIGERYGKGFVVVPSFGHADDGREVVMAHIELRLNPDGSRNVETAR